MYLIRSAIIQAVFAVVGLGLPWSGASAGPVDDCAELIMQASAAAKGETYLLEKEGCIIIGNRQIAAGFSKDTLELTALVDVAAGGRVIAAGGGALWKAALIKDIANQGDLIEISGAEARKTSFALNQSGRDAALFLHWSDISSAEEPNFLRAAVRITAKADSPYLAWTIDFDSTSRTRGLWSVDFPVIHSIRPPGEAEKTSLFLPESTGFVVANPFASTKEQQDSWFRSRGPSMQFSALYGPAGGLFLAALDGAAFSKTYHHEFNGAEKSLRYYLRNLPDNPDQKGLRYRMPYECVTTTFKGDWFTAAKLYREWAIQQVWCSRGPLHRRQDMPRWFKEIGYWLNAPQMEALGRQSTEMRVGKVYEEEIKPKLAPGQDLTLDHIEKISARLGVPLGAHFYFWHNNRFDSDLPEYFPPLIGEDAFRAQVKKIQAMGVRVMPYINGWMWGSHLPSYKEHDAGKSTVKDEQGKPRGQGACGDWMCPYTALWKDKIEEISMKLVKEYGVDGVYYDQVSGVGLRCFDSGHGHPVGANAFHGVREMLRQSREAMRRVNPDAIMTGECLSEVLMDCMDGLLLSVDQTRTGMVPAFQAVYNDYFVLFGNFCYRYSDPAPVVPMVVGESFVAGDQLGWFEFWYLFWSEHPRLLTWDEAAKKYVNQHPAWKDAAATTRATDFIVDIARLRYHAGQKYLVYGEMMRPLVFKDELPWLEGWWQQFGPAPEIKRFPGVMNSVWRAPDGTLGLVLANITDREQKVRFDLDLTDYGMPRAKSYRLTELAKDGTPQLLKKSRKSSFRTELTIPALSGYILEISTE